MKVPQLSLLEPHTRTTSTPGVCVTRAHSTSELQLLLGEGTRGWVQCRANHGEHRRALHITDIHRDKPRGVGEESQDPVQSLDSLSGTFQAQGEASK